MPALKTEDVAALGLPGLRSKMKEVLDEAESIRQANDGTLAGVPGEKAETVKNLLDSANLLGEKIDELKELDEADDTIDGHKERLDPDSAVPAPTGEPGGSKRRGEVKGAQDLGGLFTESDAWKSFKEDGKKEIEARFPMSSLWAGYKGIGEVPAQQGAIPPALKTLFDTTGYPSERDFRPEPILQLFQANNIGPLMAQGTTNQATVRTVKETVTSSGAAAVAEGVGKPEAQVAFTPTDEPVRKLAVWLPLTDEALEDIGFLRSYVNARLRLFVQNEEDRQLLVGSGVGQNLTGLLLRSGIDVSTSYSLAGANPDQAALDSIFKASMRVRDAFLEPDGFVAKPAVWEKIRLAKDSQRNYIMGAPTEDAPVRVWGLSGKLNANMPTEVAANKPILVGAFGTAAMIARRSEIAVAVSDSHSTFFTENKLAIRAEERLALLVFRPAAFAAVTSAA